VRTMGNRYFAIGKISKYLLALLLIGYCQLPIANAIQQPKTEAEEYALKAAFLYNFTKYIEWNSSNNGDEFIIGVVGYSPVIKYLADIAQTKSVNGKKIVIKQFFKPDEIKFCHLLFIPQQSNYTLQAILAKVGRGTLTVSEEDGYAAQGTALNFVLVNNRLKFESNIKALDEAGLKASSDLLKLAIIVD
jgi:hypothetical protein